MTADGTINYGAGSIGNPIFPYRKLGSLPRDPAKLNAYFRSLDPVKTDNTSSVEFSQIEQMLFGMVLPPWLKAEMFHTLALIPLIQVKAHVKDIAGRAGVAFVLPPTRNNLKLEIILDASSYQLLARGSWDNPRLPAPDSEIAILKEYLVAGLGSTQPAIAPPSATELAAERIDYYQGHLSHPPKINRVTPGQWLYRDDLPAESASDARRDQAVPAGAEASRQGGQPVPAGQAAAGAAPIPPAAVGQAELLPDRLCPRRGRLQRGQRGRERAACPGSRSTALKDRPGCCQNGNGSKNTGGRT